MTDKTIAITSAEWDALRGLPYLQQRLYMVLRWYMSVATCRVGEVRGISLQGLREELYVEPAPGRRDSGSPTKKAVIHALEQLQLHGLISSCGNGEVLVFSLPKAGDISARQKLKGHKRGTAKGHTMWHGESLVPQGNEGVKGHAMGHTQSSLKGHTSEVRVNHPSIQASAALSMSVDKLSTGVLPVLLPGGVVDFVRDAEKRRGKLARMESTDGRVLAWVSNGLRLDLLAEAYEAAVNDREVRKNPQPINIGFLDVFIQRLLVKSKAVSRRGDCQASPVWFASPDGVAAKAREMHVEARDGETIDQLAQRVHWALAEAEEIAKQARRKRK